MVFQVHVITATDAVHFLAQKKKLLKFPVGLRGSVNQIRALPTITNTHSRTHAQTHTHTHTNTDMYIQKYIQEYDLPLCVGRKQPLVVMEQRMEEVSGVMPQDHILWR